MEQKLLATAPDVPQYQKELGRARLGLGVLWKAKTPDQSDIPHHAAADPTQPSSNQTETE